MPNQTKNNTPGIDAVNLRKNFIWNTIGSTLASFTSLFYMMIVTRLNGIDDAGIFSFAFSTAIILQVIGLYSGRTFQVTDKNKKTTDSDYFYMKAVTCSVMLLVGLVFCLLRGYTGEKLAVIMFLIIFRILEAVAESAYAAIQKKDRLYQVGRSMCMKALLSLAGFFIVDYLTRNIVLASLLVIIGHLIPIIFYDLPKLAKTGFHFGKFDAKKVQYLLQIGFFTFGFTFLNMYLINAARYALDSTGDDSVQTIYGIIVMPATVLGLVGQYLVQPFLTSFKKLFVTGAQQFRSLVVKLCLVLTGVGVICVLATWLLGIPVLELLYAIDLDGNQLGLTLIIIGGTFSTMTMVISTALITMRRTSDQFWIYCAVSLITLGLSHLLVGRYGIFGAYLSYLSSMLLLFVLYVGVFAYRIHGLKQNFTEEVQRATQE